MILERHWDLIDVASNHHFFMSICGVLFWILALLIQLGAVKSMVLSTFLNQDALMILIDDLSVPVKTLKMIFSTMILSWYELFFKSLILASL